MTYFFQGLIVIIFILNSYLTYSFTVPKSFENRQSSYSSRYRKLQSGFTIDGGYFFTPESLSGPTVGYGWGGGYGGGIALELRDRFAIAQIRFDVNYYKWSLNNNSFSRMPFYFGIRGYLAVRKQQVLCPYIGYGFELSSDKPYINENTIHFGMSFEGGLEIRIDKLFLIGFNARYHIIQHPYITMGPYGGITF